MLPHILTQTQASSIKSNTNLASSQGELELIEKSREQAIKWLKRLQTEIQKIEDFFELKTEDIAQRFMDLQKQF